jgi:type II secretory ATPase GspE/PulE/Tfp pilus assembly ATPase PilB-like protein
MIAAQLANSSVFLVSVYKPLLMFLTFIPWAWLVSSKLDKDARRFHLNYVLYNALHMAAGVAALAAMLFVPIFWIGWPLGALLLFAPIYAYWQLRNREVPESEKFYLTTESIAARLSQAKRDRAAKAAALEFRDPQGERRTAPPRDDPGFETHIAMEEIMVPALAARATRLDIAAGPKGVLVAQTVDGVRYKRDALPAETALRVIDYLKGVGCLDVEDRRRRQSAEVKMTGPGGDCTVTMITAGSSAGQELRLMLDRARAVSKPFDGLGLLPAQLQELKVLQELEDRHGLVLFGAPAGQGLSTTAYSIIARHDAYTANVKSLEREILTFIDGVDQVQYESSNPDVDYATALLSILRRDPDVVLTSEINDRETAQAVAEGGLKGPLIYVPQRASSVVEQIQHWAKLVGDVKLAMKGLRAVMNQRLLRTVCGNCRQPFAPTSAQLEKLGLPADKVKQLYQAGGQVQVKHNKFDTCPVCGGTGYFGQTGVFQVMMVNKETRRLITNGDLKAAMAEARRNKMIFLQEAALRKVVDGDTTIEEVARVMAPHRKPGAPPRSEPNPAAAG